MIMPVSEGEFLDANNSLLLEDLEFMEVFVGSKLK